MSATVIGAGFLGARVCVELAARGHVTAVTRTGTPTAGVPAAVTFHACDLTDCTTDTLAACIEPQAPLVVCHAAGRSQDPLRVYVDGARTIANACERRSPSRVVYTSSTSALPDVDALVTEDETRWPELPRGRVQRQAEAALAEGLARAGVPLTVLRLGGLYGPGRDLRRLYLKPPGTQIPGDGMEATNLTHVDDALQAIVLALDRPTPFEGLLHVCADEHSPRRLMMQRVAEAAGAPPPQFALPAPPSGRVRGKRVCNGAVKAALGLTLRHPHHDFRLDLDPGVA